MKHHNYFGLLWKKVLNSHRLNAVLTSYSELFFMRSALMGWVLLAVTFLNPNLGVAGLFSIVVAFGFAQYLGYRQAFLASGYYTYNALLVGLSIGQLFSFSPETALYIAIAACLTFVLTVALADFFSRQLYLPILSIPFVVVTSLIYLSAARFSNLYVNELYAVDHLSALSLSLPIWLEGLFKVMGAIIFMPNALVGLVLLLIIGWHSRVLLALAVVGYYFGILLQGTFTGSFVQAFMDLNAFNYPLIAMALGGVFNIPAVKSYLIALIGVACATILIKSIDVFWAQYGIPVFTLPFIMITLGYLYVLALLGYPLRPSIFKETPEATLDYFNVAQFRYPKVTQFFLPFLDQWQVYQGFNGQWTHQGIWRYAVDFVKQGDNGQTYQNAGLHLDDYYCFKQPVSAPCGGYVAYVVDYYPDNAIGVVDTQNNWGNYVIIQDVRGLYVGLCHLAQHSVLVRPGDWVAPFQVIALCGNSGYSPQPHLHMQYQASSFLSGETLPFCFNGVQSKQTYFAHTLPVEQQWLQPVKVQPFYLQVVNFALDECLAFDVFKNDEWLETIELKVGMAWDSTFYIGRNTSRLYFGKSETTFYFYHIEGEDKYLQQLYTALPTLPFSYVRQAHWYDYVPSRFLDKGWRNKLGSLKGLMITNNPKNGDYAFESDIVVRGQVRSNMGTVCNTQVTLDAFCKFKTLQVGDYRWQNRASLLGHGIEN